MGPLGWILRVVRAHDPGAVVTFDARGLLTRPRGATSVHWLRVDDLATLNLGRELFRADEARVVFVATPEVFTALATKAPDLYDWISHRIDGTMLPPAFAVANVCAALAMPGPPRLSWWAGDPTPTLAEARPEWGVHVLRGDAPYEELRRSARLPGWRLWEGVKFAWHEARIRWAEAEAGAAGAAVLVRPALDLPGWWRVHGEALDLDARVRDGGDVVGPVEADLEPEALGLPTPGLAQAPWSARMDLEHLWGPWTGLPPATGDEVVPDDVEWTDDVTWALARPVGLELRAGDPERVVQARAREAAAVEGLLAARRWPWGPRLGSWATATGGEEATLRDALRRLWCWQASFAVERAIRSGVCSGERIDAVTADSHWDVARAWLAGEPPGTALEQAWARLRAARAREYGAWEEDIPALRELVEEEDPTLRRAAALTLAKVLDDVGRPKEAEPLLEVVRSLDSVDPAPWKDRGVARRVARRFVPGRELIPLWEAELAEARRVGDVVAGGWLGADVGALHAWAGREAHARLRRVAALVVLGREVAEQAIEQDAGWRTEDLSRHQALEGKLALVTRVPRRGRDLTRWVAEVVVESPVAGDLPPSTQTGAFWESVRAAWAAAADGLPGVAWSRWMETRRLAEGASDKWQLALCHLLRSSFGFDLAQDDEALMGAREQLASPLLPECSRPVALALVWYLGSDADSRAQHADPPWAAVELLATVTDPLHWTAVAIPFVPYLAARRDPRAVRLLSDALTRAVRFYDDASRTALPSLLTLGDQSLAQLRKDLHRAKSTRSPEAARLERLVHQLEDVLDAARDPGPELLGVDARAGLRAPAATSLPRRRRPR